MKLNRFLDERSPGGGSNPHAIVYNKLRDALDIIRDANQVAKNRLQYDTYKKSFNDLENSCKEIISKVLKDDN